MIQSIIYIFFSLWCLRLVINMVSYITLWYLKEYRVDRMMIHLTKTTQGKWIYFPEWRIPPFTIKTFTLTAVLTMSELLLFILLPYTLFIRLLLMDFLLFPLSFFFVFLFGIPTLLLHAYKIRKAKQILLQHTWKEVIGVTGSYGKTSTKEFLATILSRQYRVLKTAASKNSAIGISEVVLSELRSHHEMFVVEMGAYKLGEIAEMTNLVHPTVGIITAINAQHQDLFGSIETTMKAKYELLAGLSGKRIAVVNADNEYCYTMGTWAKRDGCDVWYVTKDKKAHPEAMFWIDHIVSDIHSLSFELHDKKEAYHVRANIRGEHFVINAALAIIAAHAAGISLRDAVKNAYNIQSFQRVMQPSIGKHGETLINDTFNNNPDASIAALTYLSKYKKKKIFVLQPMIELGKYTDASHELVGKKAAETCDEIILTNKNFLSSFLRGVSHVNPNKKVHILHTDQAAAFIKSNVNKGDAVLFKGKEAEYVWKLLQ